MGRVAPDPCSLLFPIMMGVLWYGLGCFGRKESYLVPLILKVAFYVITGVLLSSISWSTISHSAVTGDYILSFILLGMLFYVLGQFCVDRWRPEYDQQDFHPSKLWKLPQTTTREGLWWRVGFNTVVNVTVYSALAFLLVMTTTAQPPFLILLGTLFLLRVPHLYWSLRMRYEQVVDTSKPTAGHDVFIYRGAHRLIERHDG